MNCPKRIQILKLYKDLLRYGQQLKLTDKKYFEERIKTEFRKNIGLTDEKDISYNFEKGIIVLIKRAVQ
ncbi:unnamed protein product [Brassicogethes aeneus]|uniref:Complex 1 LYR protein domain-containing protein n=1 Tax=Brassicogethes aeneus TaxID=1431903 RepID=A0A9P0FIM5_BRAAE|nr:unnamed protein product [Brassicogethes aeneus]